MTPDWDLVIHRYLDASLPEEEIRLFEQNLVLAPALRHRLAQASFDHALAHRMLVSRDVGRDLLPSSHAASFRARGWSVLAAAAILLAVGTSWILWDARPVPPADNHGLVTTQLPKLGNATTVQRFRGVVLGEIVSPKTEFAVRLRVLRVVRGTGDGTPAPGTVLRVSAERAKRLDSPSRWAGVFLKRVQLGQTIEIELHHKEKDDYVIGELTPEQMQWTQQLEKTK